MEEAIVFVLASDTHLEMFSVLTSFIKERLPHIKTVAISNRLFYFKEDYDPKALALVFDKVYSLTPFSQKQKDHFWKKAVRRIFHKINPDFNLFSEDIFTATIKEISNTYAVKFAYFSNDRFFSDKALIHLFNKKKIPTVLMQESIRRDNATASKENGAMNGQGGCKYIVAWGKTSFEYYTKAGIEKERIYLLGNPRIDKFVREASLKPAASIKQQMNIPPGSKVYLIASNPIHSMMLIGAMSKMEYLLTLHETIATILEEVPESYIILKPHLLDIPFWQEAGLVNFYNSNSRVIYSKDISLSDAITVSDISFIFNSTVALEAALLNKRSAILNFYQKNHGCDFAENGISSELTSKRMLVEYIRDNATQTGLKQNAKKYIEILGDDMGRYLFPFIS